MADETADCTYKQGIPQLNHSSLLIKTPSDFTTGSTIDISTYFDEIWTIHMNDADGDVADINFNATTRVLTAGTITQGVHYISVDGIKY